jgi:hypothetical protein
MDEVESQDYSGSLTEEDAEEGEDDSDNVSVDSADKKIMLIM